MKNDLERALDLLDFFADGCSSVMYRRNSETCQEYYSNMQGVPRGACPRCEARKLLAENGRGVNLH